MWLKNLLLFVLISFAEWNSACLMPILIVPIYFLISYMWLFVLTCSFFYSFSVISDNFSSMFFTSQDTPSIWSREVELWICTCLPFILIEMEIPQSKIIFYFILQLSVRSKKILLLAISETGKELCWLLHSEMSEFRYLFPFTIQEVKASHNDRPLTSKIGIYQIQFLRSLADVPHLLSNQTSPEYLWLY